MIQSHFSMELLRHSMSTKWFKAKLNRNAHNIKTLSRQKKLNYRDLEILAGITVAPFTKSLSCQICTKQQYVF